MVAKIPPFIQNAVHSFEKTLLISEHKHIKLLSQNVSGMSLCYCNIYDV